MFHEHDNSQALGRARRVLPLFTLSSALLLTLACAKSPTKSFEEEFKKAASASNDNDEAPEPRKAPTERGGNEPGTPINEATGGVQPPPGGDGDGDGDGGSPDAAVDAMADAAMGDGGPDPILDSALPLDSGVSPCGAFGSGTLSFARNSVADGGLAEGWLTITAIAYVGDPLTPSLLLNSEFVYVSTDSTFLYGAAPAETRVLHLYGNFGGESFDAQAFGCLAFDHQLEAINLSGYPPGIDQLTGVGSSSLLGDNANLLGPYDDEQLNPIDAEDYPAVIAQAPGSPGTLYAEVAPLDYYYSQGVVPTVGTFVTEAF